MHRTRKPAAVLASLLSLLSLLLLQLAPSILAAEPGGVQSAKEATTQGESDWADDRWRLTEIGPFLTAAIQTPGKPTPNSVAIAKGIAIKVGPKQEGTVVFDADLLRYRAGWTGGFLEMSSQRYGLISALSPKGEMQFTSPAAPGCSPDGAFVDPRPSGFGPLPRSQARYKGLHLGQDRVAVEYTVGNLRVLDSPALEFHQRRPVFTRELRVIGTGEITFRIAEAPGGLAAVAGAKPRIATLLGGPKDLAAVAISSAEGELHAERGAILYRLNCHGQAAAKIALLIGADESAAAKYWNQEHPIPDLAQLDRENPPRWNPELETKGIVGAAAGPFAIDTLSVPYANPWHALFFTSGHDFLENGEAAVATAHGDVWLVSGLDASLASVKWKRFATGLHQPLGLKVFKNKIHVLERDQITILHDLNGDREADFYENFNNDCISTGGGHSYATSLETDADGNFYFTKCAENTPYGGTAVRVRADGSGLEVLATGFRNPNGMGVGPGGEVTVADQQGNWVPETRLDLIHPGGFYGYMPMHHRETAPAAYDPPLCWIPRAADNSAGGQVWVPPGVWGPLAGQMLHLSYGRCTFMAILRDGPRFNGGVVPLPGRFLSGVMRGRFNPRDQALYLTGLRGWQTAAIKDGCFQRVRHTGQPLLAPVAFAVRPNGVELTFDQPLNAELAADPSSYDLEQWNYRWSEKYGSPDLSPSQPGKEGRDKIKIARAVLSGERAVFLEFVGQVQPVHTLRINYNLETAGGAEIRGDFYATINQVE